MRLGFNRALPEPEAAPLWLDRVPPQSVISLAGAGLGSASLVVAVLAARQESAAVLAGELALAAAAFAIMMLAPAPSVALVPTAALVGLDAAADGAFTPATAGLGGSLVLALAAASYLRVGIRRRDVELAVATETVIDLSRRRRIARKLSRVDEHTWLEAEVARAQRHAYPAAFVLVGPDDEASFADVDRLETLAGLIAKGLRVGDVALRQDEATFAVVLPYSESEGARVAAERIRLSTVHQIEHGSTVSAGIASFPADGTSAEDLVRGAERALGRARLRGGNRTVCASVPTGLPAGWSLSGGRG